MSAGRDPYRRIEMLPTSGFAVPVGLDPFEPFAKPALGGGRVNVAVHHSPNNGVTHETMR